MSTIKILVSKKNILAIICLSLLLILTSCSTIQSQNSNLISYKELDYFISEESNIYVLFEREDCKECKEFVPELKKIH